MSKGRGSTVEALKQAVPGLAVVETPEEVGAKSHDAWMRALLERRMGVEQRGLAVARPQSAAEVGAVLEWAEASGTAVVPFGLGSGVCGAVLAARDEIIVDLGGMDRILDLNEHSLTVTVQPGMRGSDFEAELAGRGYTMGHFPQSIALSSVGGWCATRASGQHSTLYGNIENMLLGCELALPGGRVLRLPAVPRSATGPDLKHLLLGSEGTLGIFTELTFRIHPIPERRKGGAFSFDRLADGVETLRRALRAGWTPSVTRLYDAREAGRNFAGVAGEGEAVLLLLSEGPAARVEAEQAALASLATELGGQAHGEGPIQSWLEHRNDVPSFESLLDQGLVVDTIEIAAPWERLVALWDAVVDRAKGVEGMLVMSGHVSHCYTQGANIYFTFVGAKEEMSDRLKIYDAAWELTLAATHEHGGTIAHHHGIGRMRKQWLLRELGPAHELLVALKRAFDPKGIMNPGVLLDV